jgi:hypothetical protein
VEEGAGGDEGSSGHVHLISILVESLAVLGKLPETNEVSTGKIAV